jgi:hypothetical protein
MVEMFNCLASWLKFGGEFSIKIASSPLLPACFDAVKSDNEELMDASREAVVEMIRLCSHRAHQLVVDPATKKPLPEAQTLRGMLMPQVFGLVPRYEQLLAKEDVEGARELGRMFGELADQMVGSVIHELLFPAGKADTMGAVIRLVLLLSANENHEIFRLSFYFWYLVGDETNVLEDDWKDEHGGQARQPGPYLTVKAGIAPHYLTFLGHLMKVIQCPADQAGLLEPQSELMDLRERIFDDRRSDIMGVMAETCMIASSNTCADHFWAMCQTPGAPWMVVEAGIFLIMTVMRQARPTSTVAPLLAQAVVSLPAACHPQLRQTAVRVVGEMSSWASEVQGAVGPLFQFLLANVQVRPLLPVALRSIARMCKDVECRKQMGAQLGDIVKIVLHQNALGLERTDVIDMIKAASRIIAALPLDGAGLTVTGAVDALVAPLLQAIQKTLTADDPRGSATALELISKMFATLHIPSGLLKDRADHPCTGAANQSWLAITACLARHPAAPLMAEEANRCTKALFRCLGRFAAPLLPQAIDQNMRLFQEYHHSSCLYIAGKLVELFGKEQTYADAFFKMLTTFSQTTFAKLTGLPAMVENTDLVEDYCILVNEFLRARPDMLLQTELGGLTLQFGVATLGMRHREANDRASEFVRRFVGSHRSDDVEQKDRHALQQLTRQVMTTHGHSVVYAAMKGLAGGLPPENRYIDNMSVLLWEVHLLMPTECAAWLRDVLMKPELCGGRVTDAQKTKLCAEFENPELANGRMELTRQDWFRRHLMAPFARLFHSVTLVAETAGDDD